MNTHLKNVIDCESISVRVAPGEYFEFAVVDNKDMFPHFFKTSESFNIQLQCNCIDSLVYALYERKGNIAYLVCSWEHKSEINDAALGIIRSRPNLSYLLN
ncbi:hypothetical protein [Pantoea sp. NGS-ED-1003]|uniref:hypothetical protein n=1 Tax=Pantoea sp. NGS-ED-1003 TaxID=1526743 RepID=UPI0012681233|nr:hypothetical protein [Pantoea sp. NGS-ED-1003]